MCTLWLFWLVLLGVLNVSIFFMVLHFCMQHFDSGFCFSSSTILHSPLQGPSFSCLSAVATEKETECWLRLLSLTSTHFNFMAYKHCSLLNMSAEQACILGTTQQSCQVSHLLGISTGHSNRKWTNNFNMAVAIGTLLVRTQGNLFCIWNKVIQYKHLQCILKLQSLVTFSSWRYRT